MYSYRVVDRQPFGMIMEYHRLKKLSSGLVVPRELGRTVVGFRDYFEEPPEEDAFQQSASGLFLPATLRESSSKEDRPIDVNQGVDALPELVEKTIDEWRRLLVNVEIGAVATQFTSLLLENEEANAPLIDKGYIPNPDEREALDSINARLLAMQDKQDEPALNNSNYGYL